MAKRTNITGETRIMNCGMSATCIAYRNAGDIDVQFDDGTIIEHRRKGEFEKGEIKNPNLPNQRLTNIVGESRLMKNGQFAKCVKYVNANSIDVQFEDGTIVENKSKDSFYKGAIANPNCYKASCLHNVRVMNNGQKAECIRYNGYDDIDIQFEDGTIIRNKNKGLFISGSIANPNYNPFSCEGQKVLMNNGQEATCISDNGCADIDIQFEDGITVRHKRREAFLRGNIKNPSRRSGSFPELLVYESLKKYFKDIKRCYRPKWLINPETGKRMEIDIWIPSVKIGIEYDGVAWHKKENARSKTKAKAIEESSKIVKLFTILEAGCVEHHSHKHVNYRMKHDSNDYEELLPELHDILIDILLCLQINEPELDFSEEALDEIRKRNFNEVLGKTVLMQCGMNATCIAYRSYHDIDVKFDDGIIVSHKQKHAFVHGTIAHPDINTKTYKTSCLGQTKMMKCGMNATCIEYRDSNDLDVEFDDGTIIRHRQKENFLRGAILNPNMIRVPKSSCLNETVLMNNGQNAKCVAFRNADDIDIEFEDGTIVKHKSKHSFFKGSISNPNFNPHSCLGVSVMQRCGYSAKCIAYRGTLDIDVEFEDGTIVSNRTKKAFLNGGINKDSASCLGETRMMSCGMKATCIKWRGTLDIDVEFEDGTIVKNRNKANFYRGYIGHPGIHMREYAYRNRGKNK